jgi:predicted dehydrogenase
MPPVPEHRPVDRRKFLRRAAAGATLALTANGYGAVAGSNTKVRLAVLGCGGRAQAHVHAVTQLAAAGTKVTIAAVCDVWDGHADEYESTFGGRTTRRKYSQGLYPTAAAVGLHPDDPTHVVKDYRRLLDLKSVDAVCVATPDHWHARMVLDSLAAGKDVYCERPLARSVAQANAVAEAAADSDRVVAVGVQSLTDPSIAAALKLIQADRLGSVVHLQGGAFRNDARGQWRFYRTMPQMNPKTVDWDLFLGHRFEAAGERLGPPKPFDAATFAQWRCDDAFSGGPVTDLLNPVVTRLLAASGMRDVKSVTSSSGLYQERDGRSVPDVVTLLAEFAEGCHLNVTATTLSNYPVEEVVRGRLGAVKLVRGGLHLFADDPAKGTKYPPRLEQPIQPTEVTTLEPPRNETEAAWKNFLDCCERRDKNTFCPPELAAAAIAITQLPTSPSSGSPV